MFRASTNLFSSSLPFVKIQSQFYQTFKCGPNVSFVQFCWFLFLSNFVIFFQCCPTLQFCHFCRFCLIFTIWSNFLILSILSTVHSSMLSVAIDWKFHSCFVLTYVVIGYFILGKRRQKKAIWCLWRRRHFIRKHPSRHHKWSGEVLFQIAKKFPHF